MTAALWVGLALLVGALAGLVWYWTTLRARMLVDVDRSPAPDEEFAVRLRPWPGHPSSSSPTRDVSHPASADASEPVENDEVPAYDVPLSYAEAVDIVDLLYALRERIAPNLIGDLRVRALLYARLLEIRVSVARRAEDG